MTASPSPRPAHPPLDADLEDLLRQLSELVHHDEDLPDPDTAAGRNTREFFSSTWEQASTGLLARTDKLRVTPQPPGVEAPRVFRFELDVPYKSKRAPDAPVELQPGPLRGSIRYRPDLLLAEEGQPCIAVSIDREHALWHPNFSRMHGLLCVGGLPTGAFPLDTLLEHVYTILTYQNISTSDPADQAAARYFALDPDARSGLETVEALY